MKITKDKPKKPKFNENTDVELFNYFEEKDYKSKEMPRKVETNSDESTEAELRNYLKEEDYKSIIETIITTTTKIVSRSMKKLVDE